MRLWLASVLLAATLPLAVSAQVRLENPPEFVATLYRHILGREASAVEIHAWARALQKDTTPDELRANFIGSDEFYTKHHKDSQRFLVAAFAKVFLRPPTPEELRSWGVRYFALGTNRVDLARELIRAARFAPPPPPPPPPPPVVIRPVLPPEPIRIRHGHPEVVAQAEVTVVLVELFLGEIDRCREASAVASVRGDARKLETTLHQIRRTGAGGSSHSDLRHLLRDANEDWRILRERRHFLNIAIPTLRLPVLADVNDSMERLAQVIRSLS